MHDVEIALGALMMLGLVIFMAPSVLALNRGRALRNIAIWLAIFVILAFVYKDFGPGKSLTAPAPAATQEQTAPAAADKNDGNQGFTPPQD